jgi:hypothetical protein
LDKLLIVFVEHTLWKLQGMPPAMETNQWWLTAQQRKKSKKRHIKMSGNCAAKIWIVCPPFCL